jgi:uncharacterized membrane protein
MKEINSMFTVAGVLSILMILLVTISLFMLPTYYILLQNWDGFIYWIPIIGFWARVLYVISIPLYVSLGLYRKKAGYVIAGLYSILMIWGVPLLYGAYLSMATGQLTTMLDLSKAILTIMFIDAISISISLMMKKGLDE